LLQGQLEPIDQWLPQRSTLSDDSRSPVCIRFHNAYCVHIAYQLQVGSASRRSSEPDTMTRSLANRWRC
jgi:hypothetical protein